MAARRRHAPRLARRRARWLRAARRRRARRRQPPGGAGRRLHRLARRRAATAAATSPRRSPPARAPAWSRPTASKRSASTATARRRAARAEGRRRRHRQPLPRRRRASSSTSSPSPAPTARPRPRGGSRRRCRRSAGAAASSARSASASRRRARQPTASVAAAATGLTTPDPVTLQTRAAATSSTRGFAACAIEASSIGIAEHRLAGTRIAVAVFTNFTPGPPRLPRRHGRVLGRRRRSCSRWPGLRAAVVNLDDAQGRRARRRARRLGRSTAGPSRCAARRRGCAPKRLAPRPRAAWRFDRASKAASASRSRRALIGDYNVANLLGVIGVLRALGVAARRRGARLRRR